MVEQGQTVKLNYVLTVEGNELDKTPEGQPFEYVAGENQIIKGLEAEVANLSAGDKKKIVISAENAYGLIRDELLKEVNKSSFGEEIELLEGMVFDMQDEQGNKFPGIIKEIKEECVLMDFNHPLAGKELQFDVEIIEIS